MEEDIVLVCRKSKISMQEGREVEGKSVIRISLLNIDYSEDLCKLKFCLCYSRITMLRVPDNLNIKTSYNQGRVVRKPVNANPGLNVS